MGIVCLAALALVGAACGRAHIGDPEPGSLENGDESPDASLPPDARLPSDASPAPIPDAAVPTPDAFVQATCEELFGTAPEYILCSQSEQTCSFNALTNGGNCKQMCEQYGAICVAAYDNNSPDFCVAQGPDTCLTNRTTEICVCTRPDVTP